jgi:hypothetical protein
LGYGERGHQRFGILFLINDCLLRDQREQHNIGQQPESSISTVLDHHGTEWIGYDE